MSASEKLKALNLEPFAFVENQSGTEAVAIELSRFRQWQKVHPQIVAVVKRLEWCEEAFDYISGRDVAGWDAHVPTEVVAIGARDQVRLALAALEEALQ